MLDGSTVTVKLPLVAGMTSPCSQFLDFDVVYGMKILFLLPVTEKACSIGEELVFSVTMTPRAIGYLHTK
jgi:hypothetical protein